jgi:hypothetical protein
MYFPFEGSLNPTGDLQPSKHPLKSFCDIALCNSAVHGPLWLKNAPRVTYFTTDRSSLYTTQMVCGVKRLRLFLPVTLRNNVGHGLLVLEVSRWRRNTVGRTHLDELSARGRDLYLATHNTHTPDRLPCPLSQFEPANPALERPRNHALDRAATGNGFLVVRHGNYVAATDAPHAANAGLNTITRT